MDKYEELYSEMYEDDDFYMGDRDDEDVDESEDYDDYESGAEYAYCNTSSSNNVGCLLLPFIITLMAVAVVLVV